MEGLKTYDTKAPVLIWKNINVLEGTDSGTFFEADNNEDGYTLICGSDGSKVRVKMANDSKRITVRLLQTSNVNALLQAQYDADRILGTGPGPLLYKEANTTTLFRCPDAYLVRPAGAQRGGDHSPQEWIFELPNPAPGGVGVTAPNL